VSQYQYYDFRSLDRPLTVREMEELRGLSTRAEITPSRFTNEYSYGSFRGDPYAMVEKYFDAFLYLADWGSHWLMLRLPRGLLDPEEAAPFEQSGVVSLKPRGENVLVEFRIDAEPEGWVEAEGRLDALLPLREELLAGDLRPLYLGWLAGVNEAGSGEAGFSDEEAEEAHEPPPPPGLTRLTAAQKELAEFLFLDADLLAAAATTHPGEPPAPPGRPELAGWIAALPEKDKNGWLLRLAEDDPTARAELLQRFRRELRKSRRDQGGAPKEALRSVAVLRAAHDARAEAERRAEEQRKALEQAERELREAAERTRRLESLTPREDQAWREAEALVKAARPREYDQAVALLLDLLDLARREGREDEARRKVRELCERHAGKKSFLQRLDRAGLRE
jgi:hypothetical protein